MALSSQVGAALASRRCIGQVVCMPVQSTSIVLLLSTGREIAPSCQDWQELPFPKTLM